MEDLKVANEEIVKIAPEVKELDAIKEFCNGEVKRKKILEVLAASVKSLKSDQKKIQQGLKKEMQTTECFALSKADATEFDALAQKMGLEEIPKYVRLVRTSKDANITSEIIKEALENINTEDIAEEAHEHATSAPKEVIKNLVLTNIRRLIRSFTINLKLMKSIVKGTSIYEIPDAPKNIANEMWQLWITEQEIKKKMKSRPEGCNKDLKERVENYFIRTGLTAQRIVVEGQPFRLVRKISIRKGKVGIGCLENLLDEVLKTFNPEKFNPNDLIHDLHVQISALPPETKTTLGLAAVKTKE